MTPLVRGLARSAEVCGVVVWGFGVGIPAAWPRTVAVTVGLALWWCGARLRAPDAAPGVLVLAASALWVLQAFAPGVPVPLFVVALVACRAGWARRRQHVEWLGSGPRTVLGALLLVGVAVAGSAFWLSEQSDLLFLRVPDVLAPLLRSPSTAWLVVGAAAAVNACAEEVIWRGDALDRLAVDQRTSLTTAVASSTSFALAHVWAVPDGVAGVLLTFGFGVLAVGLNRWSRSLLPSFCGHVAADVILGAHLLGLTTVGIISS